MASSTVAARPSCKYGCRSRNPHSDLLLDALHDDFRDVSDRGVDSHIKNLRKKIDAVAPGMQCIRRCMA